MTECPGCGTAIPVAGARFCHGCGRPLEPNASASTSAVEVTLEAPAPVPQATALEDGNGARPWAAMARLGYARALANRPNASDHDLARSLLAESRSVMEELGLGLHRRLAGEIERKLG